MCLCVYIHDKRNEVIFYVDLTFAQNGIGIILQLFLSIKNSKYLIQLCCCFQAVNHFIICQNLTLIKNLI